MVRVGTSKEDLIKLSTTTGRVTSAGVSFKKDPSLTLAGLTRKRS